MLPQKRNLDNGEASTFGRIFSCKTLVTFLQCKSWLLKSRGLPFCCSFEISQLNCSKSLKSAQISRFTTRAPPPPLKLPKSRGLPFGEARGGAVASFYTAFLSSSFTFSPAPLVSSGGRVCVRYFFSQELV